jgi:hypothetical protein
MALRGTTSLTAAPFGWWVGHFFLFVFLLFDERRERERESTGWWGFLMRFELFSLQTHKAVVVVV